MSFICVSHSCHMRITCVLHASCMHRLVASAREGGYTKFLTVHKREGESRVGHGMAYPVALAWHSHAPVWELHTK